MRILAMSDLHHEFLRGRASSGREFMELVDYPSPAGPVNFVALAGDIDIGTWGVTWAGTLAQKFGVPVVYVPGNHEFYGHDYVRLMDELRQEAAAQGVLLLQNDEVRIGGVRFLGCTLWTDFLAWPFDADSGNVRSTPADAWYNMKHAGKRMNDFWYIRRGDARFSPQASLELHRESRKFLDEKLAQPFDGPTVVVTHHGPHPLCNHPRFGANQLSAAFWSDLGLLIALYGPDLWVYGHTHSALDTHVGQTRLYSNQRGYVFDPIPGFDPAHIIEIAGKS